MPNRLENELQHNKKILKEADQVWGRLGRAGRARVERRAKEIISRCGIGPQARVLEIGCGTGVLTRYLTASEAQITATDLYDAFLETAGKDLAAPNVRFVAADASTLAGFPDQEYDVVCGLSILHHLDISQALANIFRVLKKGGRIGFSEPNMLNPQIAIQKNIPVIKRWMGDSPDETAFIRFSLARWLRAAGYINIRVRPFDFLHPAIPDWACGGADRIGRALEGIPGLREIAGSLFIFAEK